MNKYIEDNGSQVFQLLEKVVLCVCVCVYIYIQKENTPVNLVMSDLNWKL